MQENSHNLEALLVYTPVPTLAFVPPSIEVGMVTILNPTVTEGMSPLYANVDVSPHQYNRLPFSPAYIECSEPATCLPLPTPGDAKFNVNVK